MLSFIYRKLLLPAFETGIKRRKCFRYWKELERSQWLGEAELERLQLDRLCRLLTHAWAHCDYYREAWLRAGLSPEHLGSPDDWRRWPVIDRDTITANRLRMRARVPGMRLLSKSTGGSSGAPLHFDLDTD